MTTFGTVEGWAAYASKRGTAVLQDGAASAALVRASDYIRTTYPDAITEPLPDAVVEATYVAAGYELATPGFWSKVWTEGDRKVLTEANGIKWTVVGSGAGMGAAIPRSTLIEGLLAGLVGAKYFPGVLVV